MKVRDKNILQVIKRKVHSVAPGADVLLFGSRARGDYQSDSDGDVLVLLNKDKITDSDFDSIVYPLYEYGWTIGELISTKLYTTKEWSERSFTPFYKNIAEQGIAL